MKPEEQRAERLARIRARRGTAEREEAIRAIAEARAKRHALADLAEASEREWIRRFDRADLATQARMLAEHFGDDHVIGDAMRTIARTLPAGYR